MSGLVAGVLGALLGFGVLLIIAGARGALPRWQPRAGAGRFDRFNIRLGLAIGAGIAAYALTRWPVAAAAAALLGWSMPTVTGARAKRRREVERIEAIARWAEQLRDTMKAAAGLHEAIGVTARVAPLPIRQEVEALAARLRRQPLAHAARQFAADVANPAGDHVAVALVLAADRHGARLSEVLGQVAAATRAEAAMRLRVEAQRARTHNQAQLISGVIGAVVLVYIVLNRGYLAPFGTPVGQAVLGLVCGLWFASLWALVRLAEVGQGERILAPTGAEHPVRS
jgi:Flp pilus assembly protein TadB